MGEASSVTEAAEATDAAAAAPETATYWATHAADAEATCRPNYGRPVGGIGPRQGGRSREGQGVRPPRHRVTADFGAGWLGLRRPPTQGVGRHGARLDAQHQHALLTGAGLSQGGDGRGR